MFEFDDIDCVSFRHNPRLHKVKQFVDSHFSEPVSLELAAGVAGLEKTYFSRFFRRKTGLCFRDWLRRVRVKHAVDIMVARDLTVTEIAFMVGFQDLRTFERAVAKCTGLSPKAVKHKLRQPGD